MNFFVKTSKVVTATIIASFTTFGIALASECKSPEVIRFSMIPTECLAPYIRPLIFGFSNKVSGTGGRMFNA